MIERRRASSVLLTARQLPSSSTSASSSPSSTTLTQSTPSPTTTRIDYLPTIMSAHTERTTWDSIEAAFERTSPLYPLAILTCVLLALIPTIFIVSLVRCRRKRPTPAQDSHSITTSSSDHSTVVVDMSTKEGKRSSHSHSSFVSTSGTLGDHPLPPPPQSSPHPLALRPSSPRPLQRSPTVLSYHSLYISTTSPLDLPSSRSSTLSIEYVSPTSPGAYFPSSSPASYFAPQFPGSYFPQYPPPFPPSLITYSFPPRPPSLPPSSPSLPPLPSPPTSLAFPPTIPPIPPSNRASHPSTSLPLPCPPSQLASPPSIPPNPPSTSTDRCEGWSASVAGEEDRG